ncbi:MAG TPA: hypothetical protein VF600_00935 [Abditibacteriaceae bacterium]|jgi:hypothetical protein
MIVAAQIVSSILQLVRWGLLVAFGIWLHRRLPLRSLPWAGAYLLLTAAPLMLANTFLLRWLVGKQTLPFGWSSSMSTGAFVTKMITGSRLFGAAAMLILTIMVLSDLIFLLSRAGIEPDRKAVRRLLVLRDWSTPLGLAVIALTVVSQMFSIFLNVFI